MNESHDSKPSAPQRLAQASLKARPIAHIVPNKLGEEDEIKESAPPSASDPSLTGTTIEDNPSCGKLY